MQYEEAHDRFSVKFGLVIMPADYTTFDQDAASKAQVGNQHDEFEARSLRLMARGHFELFRKWNYVVRLRVQGLLDQTSTADWNVTDMKAATVLGPRLGTLTLGKMKEPHAYEMVGDAANLAHMERLLNPFFTSRSWGARLNRTAFDKRMTLAVGTFNDWFSKDIAYSDSGWDVAARVTALPWMDASGRRFLHVAGSWRYVGADEGVVRYRGRPESNVADYYVDTGKIPADHANQWGGELL